MPRINEAHALAATARYLARKAIAEQLRRSGLRPIEVGAADIVRGLDWIGRVGGTPHRPSSWVAIN